MISVLYVDDEEGLLQIAKLFLEKSGEFSVATATSAEEALESPKLLSYDAIVSDYQMPDMDGITLLKAVRERSGDIPFILFTGRGREEVVIDAINNGADFYLQKGGDPKAQFAELAHKIRQAVRRKQAERSLVDSERRLADIIDFLPDATFAIDTSGTVIAWNRAIEEMTGIPAGEMVGKGNYEYALPFYGSRRPILIDLIDATESQITRWYSHVFRTGATLTAETDLPHPKGHSTTVLAKVCYLYNQGGEITGAIESIRDITERKHLQTDLEKKHQELRASYEQLAATEEELRYQYRELAAVQEEVKRQKQQLEEIAATVPGVVYQFSVEADGKMRVNYVSSRGPEVFGPTGDTEDFFQWFIAHIDPRDREAFLRSIDDVVRAASPWDFQGRFIKPSGDTIWFQGLSRPVWRGPDLVFNGVLLDITDRREAEAAIRENEQKYRALIETTGTGYVIIDGDGCVLDANPEYIRLTGHTTLPDIAGRNVLEWTAGYEKEKNAQAVRQCTRDGFLRNFEIDYCDRDGRITPVEINATVIRSENPIQILTLCRDISERRRAADALRESEERYRIFVETANEGIWSIDADFRTIFTNRKIQEIFGYSGSEMAGRQVWDFVPPEDVGSMKDSLRERQTGRPGRYERRWRRKDGTDVWCLTSASPLFSPEGKFLGSFGMFTDITERRGADEALRESEAKYRTVVEQSNDAIFIAQDSRLVFHNRAFATMTGHTDSELNGTSIADLIAPEDRDRVMKKHRERLLDKSTRDVYEFSVLHHDGTTRIPVIMDVSPGSFGGRPATIGTLHNVTEEGKRVWALRESEERFRGMAERSSDLVLILNKEMSPTYVSPSSRSILGYDPAELVGKPPEFAKATIFSETGPGLMKAVQATMHGELVDNAELRLTRKDGSPVYVSVYAVPVMQDGDLTGAQISMRDITAKKTAENALRESENKFATVFNSSPVSLALVSVREGTFTEVNDAFLRNTGYSREEVIGRTPEALAIFPDVDEYQRFVAALREGRAVYGMEMKCRVKSGRVQVCRFTSGIILTGEEPYVLSSVEDITELKATEEALRESEEKFRSIVETSPNIIWEGDLAGHFRYVSPLVTAILGYTPEEFVSIPTTDLLTEKGKALLLQVIARIKASGKIPPSFEIPVRHRDGSEIILEIRPSLMGPGGDLSGIRGVAIDITERKRIETALRENEEKFRTIVEASPGIIWEVDLRGVLGYISPIVTDIMGYLPADLIGRPITDLIREESRGSVMQEFSRYISSPGPIPPLEVPARHKDGRDLFIEIRPARMINPEGKLTGFRGVAVDISERRRAEETLQKNRKQLEEAMDIANLVNWEYDVDTDLFTFDDRFYALYGTTTEKEGGVLMSSGRYAQEFVHPDDRHLVAIEIGKARKAKDPGYVSQVEHRIIRRDGVLRYVMVRIGITKDKEGRTIKTHGANQDITDRKRAEEALRLANHKINLLGTITRHDILNKIAVIQGYIATAGLQFHDPAVEGLLKKIDANAKVIQSQMEFTRTYESLGTHEPQWIDLEAAMPRSHVPASIAFNADVRGISVYADPMLEKVFFNLIDNAIRHGERVTEIRVTSRTDGGELVVIWEDNGVGIPPGEKECIFERGYGKHTGLGMFLAREILSLTGITIRETGEPGKGARFELHVPNGAHRP